MEGVMRKTVAILSFTLALVVAPSLFAQATRTWVSGVGDDANPCSRTAPCKTFAGAISKTAAGGEISVLDPGGFGAINITKSITLNGAGTLASILFSGTNGVIVNGAGITVNIKDISLNGGTPVSPGVNGIRIIQAASVSVLSCDIFNYSNAGILDERATGGTLTVRDTTIHNSIVFGGNQTTFGIKQGPAAGSATNRMVVDNTHVFNITGTTAIGIFVSNGGKAVIKNSSIQNAFQGLFVSGSGGAAEANVTNSSIFNNSAGVRVTAGGTARLDKVLITGNTVNGLDNGGGTIATFGNNSIAGNVGNNGAGMTAIVPAQQ
jgi:hypothetical protein